MNKHKLEILVCVLLLVLPVIAIFSFPLHNFELMPITIPILLIGFTYGFLTADNMMRNKEKKPEEKEKIIVRRIWIKPYKKQGKKVSGYWRKILVPYKFGGI